MRMPSGAIPPGAWPIANHADHVRHMLGPPLARVRHKQPKVILCDARHSRMTDFMLNRGCHTEGRGGSRFDWIGDDQIQRVTAPTRGEEPCCFRPITA